MSGNGLLILVPSKTTASGLASLELATLTVYLQYAGAAPLHWLILYM